jgi:hypothetical protein
MRFMMLVKASKESEAGGMPDEKTLAVMGKYNEDLMKAGVLLDLSGLQPTWKGARVKFSRGKSSVIDGPFSDAKELVAGYWLVQMKSKEEAIEWAKRAPFQEGEIEIRQLFELEDFTPGEAIDRARALENKLEKHR